MRARSPLAVLLLAATVGLALLAAGCGSSGDDLNVSEGEPVQLGDISYNVSISRFLNPADAEDKAYLAGQPPLPNDKQWFGVFMQLHNDADQTATVPSGLVVTDTQGNEYRPVPSQSVFALKLGGKIGSDGVLPEPESTAASGPIEGSMVLFEIDLSATENRPLTLSIPGPSGETGEIELDI